MDVLSRIRFESKVCPGVAVTFRRATVTTRARFLDLQATSRIRVRELERERKPLADEYRAAVDKARAAAKVEVDALIEAEGITRQAAEERVEVRVDFPEDRLAELLALTDRIRRIEREGDGQATLRALAMKVEGFTVDGEPVDVDGLIEHAPFELTDEIITAADQIAGLSSTERGESPWPGISQQSAAGPANSTTVQPAEPEPAAA